MSDDFEPYHVPQQTRRDKLRISNQSHDFSALFDPSLNQSFNLGPNTNSVDGFKEEGMSFMGFLGGVNMISSSSSTPTNQLMYLNPQEINDNPFVYTSPHSYRALVDQSFHGNESLSLSLSSSHNTHHSSNPFELNLLRYDYDSSVFSNNNRVSEVSRSSVPLGPFTGYATVLSGSRFLKPAHQLLSEICDVGRGIYGENVAKDSSLMDSPTSESFNGDGVVEESLNFSDVSEKSKKKSRLLSLLDEVYKRYKLYYQQIQAIVASFESVAGLSNAAPFTNLALQALSKHFKCLKIAITDQLQFTTKPRGNIDFESNETQKSKNSGHGPRIQKPLRHIGFVDQPVWRPQRGLPERAVAVLRAWLFEHFLHPYPTDTDKLMLAKEAGLSRNQVSNWFINARVRIWKPMVEEIHMLETRQSQKDAQREEPSETTLSNHLPTTSSFQCENASTSNQRTEEFTLKRSREDLTTTTRGRPMNLQYDNLSYPQLGVGVSNAGGVSLTLGPPQNVMGLSESYPILAARRLGLDAHGEGSYMLNGFASQNQQFGRDIVG